MVAHPRLACRVGAVTVLQSTSEGRRSARSAHGRVNQLPQTAAPRPAGRLWVSGHHDPQRATPPTRHERGIGPLDVASAEALERALAVYAGTVVAVSHDRWFLHGFDRFIEFGKDGRVAELQHAL